MILYPSQYTFFKHRSSNKMPKDSSAIENILRRLLGAFVLCKLFPPVVIKKRYVLWFDNCHNRAQRLPPAISVAHFHKAFSKIFKQHLLSNLQIYKPFTKKSNPIGIIPINTNEIVIIKNDFYDWFLPFLLSFFSYFFLCFFLSFLPSFLLSFLLSFFGSHKSPFQEWNEW